MHKISARHATPEPMRLQPRRTALGLNNKTLRFGASCAKNTSRPATRETAQKENGKDSQNFLNREIKVGPRTGASQVEWLQDD